MAYLFNDDKTKFPFVRDLIWEGNEQLTDLGDWEYHGSDHGIDFDNYDEFEIHTKDGVVLVLKSNGVLLLDDATSGLVSRKAMANKNTSYVYVGFCYSVTSGTEYEEFLIPTKLYGIKVGETVIS